MSSISNPPSRHNWFNFGGRPVDPDYFIETHFGISEPGADWFTRNGPRLDIARPISAPCYFPSPQGAPARDNWMLIGHRSGRQAVIVSGDFDMARFALYAEPSALCPEVFAGIKVSAGESQTWQRKHEFRAGRE